MYYNLIRELLYKSFPKNEITQNTSFDINTSNQNSQMNNNPQSNKYNTGMTGGMTGMSGMPGMIGMNPNPNFPSNKPFNTQQPNLGFNQGIQSNQGSQSNQASQINPVNQNNQGNQGSTNQTQNTSNKNKTLYQRGDQQQLNYNQNETNPHTFNPQMMQNPG